MRTVRAWATVVSLALLVACAGDPLADGSLSVTVTGLPGGVAADVRVTGPGGFVEDVTATRLLTGLTPGSYTIAALDVADDHPIVSDLFRAEVSDPVVAVVADASATATVHHAWRSPSGRAWVSSFGSVGDVLFGLDRDQLASSGAPDPVAAIGYEPGTWNGIAFDGAGNAWVARWSPGASVVRFAAADLASSATLVPDVVIDSSDPAVLAGPLGLAFDGAGALWVSGYHSDTIVRYAPAQLAASGSPAPQVVLTYAGAGRVTPCGLAFDRGGALWVANLSADTVAKFTPAQLAAGGAQVPSVTLSASEGRLDGPFAVAFDAQDNLWVSSLANHSVLRFDADQLVATGAPTPGAVVTEVATPRGLAFDHRGDLWVHRRHEASETLVRLADPASLTMMGPAVFATTIELGFAVDGGFVSFFPPPAGVPIRTP